MAHHDPPADAPMTATTHPLLAMLAGGDRRSIGRAAAAAAHAEKQPELLLVLIEGMGCADPLIRMRCADAAEKATREHPERLQPHKAALLGRPAEIDQQELHWHLAQMWPRLRLTPAEQRFVWSRLCSWLASPSHIVRTCAMQGLHDLAREDAARRPEAVRLIRQQLGSGIPAVQARGRKLLAALEGRAPAQGGPCRS
jgi:hypothetical protein